MTKKPRSAKDDEGDDPQRQSQPHAYSFLDRFKQAADEKAPENPEWTRHREEFQADPKKFKAFLDRCAEAVAGPRRVREQPTNGPLLAEFSFHFGKTVDDPAGLRAALELAEIWREQHPLEFALLYTATYPDRAYDLWYAIRGRGTRGQTPALPWTVLRAFKGLRWRPFRRPDGTVIHPPFSHTLEDLPLLKKHFEAMREGVRQALDAHEAIRDLQRARVKRHEEALAELDAMGAEVDTHDEEGQLTEQFAQDFTARRRAAEPRLLDADIDERHPMRQLWFDGDVIQDGRLLTDVVGWLAPLATRLDMQRALIDELAEGSQQVELQRSAKNLKPLSRAAGELVVAIGGALPDRRRGARDDMKSGTYRKKVFARAREILRLVYGQDFSFAELRGRGQKASKRK